MRSTHSVDSSSQSNTPASGDRQVLLVEDNPMHQDLITRQLRKQGIDCLPPVRTGAEGLELARELNPAVILLDIDLADEMNGIEVAQELAGECSALVVFVSGHDNDRLMLEAQATFPFAYLTKPADPQQLSALIHGAFRYRECLNLPRDSNADSSEFVTICAWCRSVKTPQGWIPLEDFVMHGKLKRITHGVCHPCMRRMME